MSAQTWICYRPQSGDHLDAHDDRERAERALEVAGVTFTAQPGGYLPGRWRSTETGAVALVDIGDPPIEEDLQHPPRSYEGWQPLGITIEVPLSGPHWFAVEAFALIEGLLAVDPKWRVLDTEDIQERPDAAVGPFAWSRPRAIAQWERLRTTQVAGRSDLLRLPRGDSLRLWRYRRERATGSVARPDLQWPQGLVVARGGQAVTVSLWQDPTRPLALPPVQLVLVPDGAGFQVIAADSLRQATCEVLAHGLALAVPPSPDAVRISATGITPLLDEEWTD